VKATTDGASRHAQQKALLDSLGRQYSHLDRLHSVGLLHSADKVANRLSLDNERCAEVLDQSRKPNPEAIIDWDDPMLRKANEVMPDEIVDVVMQLEGAWAAVNKCIESIALCMGWELKPCRKMLESFENVVDDLSTHLRGIRSIRRSRRLGPRN